MIVCMKAPTVLVFWRGQRTADALSTATSGLRDKHTINLFPLMVGVRHILARQSTASEVV